MDWTSPRFDTPIQVALNLASIACFVFVMVTLVRRQRSERPPPLWAWALTMFLTVSIGGVYVPIGPLVALRSTRSVEPNDRNAGPTDALEHVPAEVGQPPRS